MKSLAQTKETPLEIPKLTPDNYTAPGIWGSWTAEMGGKFIDFTSSFGLAQVYMPAAIGAQILPMPLILTNNHLNCDSTPSIVSPLDPSQ